MASKFNKERWADFHPEAWSPRPGRWTVHQSPIDNGWVNNRDREASVPFPYTIVQEHIRIHEAYHVLISPDTPMDMTRRMMEEIRVHAYAYSKHVDMDYCHDLVPDLKPGEDPGFERNAAWWICQFAPTGFDREELSAGRMTELDGGPAGVADHVRAARGLITEENWPKLEKLITDLWRNPSERNADACAKRFDAIFPEENEEKGAPEPRKGEGDSKDATMPTDCGSRVAIEEYEKGSDGKWHPDPAQHADPEETRKSMIRDNELDERALKIGSTLQRQVSGSKGHRDSESARDRAILETTRALAHQLSFSKKCAIDNVITPANKTFLAQAPGGETHHGEEIYDIARIFTDRQIFKGRKAGGSVVIDCSGSMRWDWSKLRECVREMPSSTIAVYAGARDADIPSNKGLTPEQRQAMVGKLTIIARNGRWADPVKVMEEARYNGGNEVDIEALEWLSTQPEPRVWLSDGQVCGGLVDEKIAEIQRKHLEWRQPMREYFAGLCRRHRIVRTLSVDAAIDYIRSRGRTGIEGIHAWNSSKIISR